MGNRLGGKVAVITGATSGIGAASTELFAREGAKVVFAGRRRERGEPIEKKLRDQGFDVTFVTTDVRRQEDLENLVKVALDTYGKIDILFNNAGLSRYELFVDMSQDTADAILDTNYLAAYKLCKLVVPVMIEQGTGGKIVNTSSVGGMKGMPTMVAYCGSKAALHLFTKALAHEVGKYGIRVNSLHPGATDTEMVADMPGFDPKEYWFCALKRIGQPIELAYGALFLASDESSYMTGAELVLDGGGI
ncbi:MAG: glucose 1-dehydrogenase [Acidobacteriota bacterium]|nr:glucose 1-dehydrogenase [Acidobacteriota bacterium]